MKKSFFEVYTGKYEEVNRLNSYFNLEIYNVVEFYSQYFAKLVSKEFRGIRIDLNANDHHTSLEPPMDIYPICRVIFPYDLDNYMKMSADEKILEIKKILEKGSKLTCENLSLDFNQFENIFKSCTQDLCYDFNTPKSPKGSKIKANIEVRVLPGFNQFFIVKRLINGIIEKVPLVVMNGFYNHFFQMAKPNRIVTEGSWEDGNTYVVKGKKGHLERIRFEYKLDTNEVRTVFNLEADIDKDAFMEEFNYATTQDFSEIQKIIERPSSKWHLFL